MFPLLFLVSVNAFTVTTLFFGPYQVVRGTFCKNSLHTQKFSGYSDQYIRSMNNDVIIVMYYQYQKKIRFIFFPVPLMYQVPYQY